MIPRGAWVADFSDEACSLERKFSDGENDATLRLRQFGPQRDFEVTLVSKSLGLKLRNARYAFLPGEKQDLEFYQTFKIPGGERGVLFSATQFKSNPDSTFGNLAPATLAEEMQAADGLLLENVFNSDFTFRTGPLREPMKVMQTCLDDLLSQLGLDAKAHRNLSRPVTEIGDKAWPNWLETPQLRAIEQWPSDRMQFRLLVDEMGHVADCRITGAAEYAELSQKICSVMPKNYEFLPALDNGGNPIRSYYLTTITRVHRSSY